MSRGQLIIGVDTGGTFTDFVYQSDGRFQVYKCLSTPDRPSDAVIDGLMRIGREGAVRVFHGSTVATNAILEGKGARTALVTNQGFEDIIEIGRQNRTELYRFTHAKARPLVPSHHRFGISCRVDCHGRIVTEMVEDDLDALVRQIVGSQCQSVAVCLLFSFLNPDHEVRVGSALERLGVPVSLSHEVSGEFREFERMATTMVNAYVAPKMTAYIQRLSGHVGSGNLRIMQSNGGSITAETAMNRPVNTVLSGPAGGVVGAYYTAGQAGIDKLITFDMGGTSTDVALMDGSLPVAYESRVGGLPIRVPMMDIHTVGAGGGSIARIDEGGAMKVGPESAGADPGPACYGKGEHMTVTDANLVLGRLLPDYFLGGTMKLNANRARQCLDALSGPVSLSRQEAAAGILEVANTAMAGAIRVISVEKGHDPKNYTLFSFGGAGGMHALFLARMLGIPQVMIPRHPGILSALGMLVSDVRKDYARTVMLTQDANVMDIPMLSSLFEPLCGQAREELANEGISEDHMVIVPYLDMRYKGQAYELTVPFDETGLKRFHDAHLKRYGYAVADRPVEIVNLRVQARGVMEKTVPETLAKAQSTDINHAVIGLSAAIFDHREWTTSIVNREKLAWGHAVTGPAIVVEYSSTTVIPPGFTARVDRYGNLLCRRNDQ